MNILIWRIIVIALFCIGTGVCVWVDNRIETRRIRRIERLSQKRAEFIYYFNRDIVPLGGAGK